MRTFTMILALAMSGMLMSQELFKIQFLGIDAGLQSEIPAEEYIFDPSDHWERTVFNVKVQIREKGSTSSGKSLFFYTPVEIRDDGTATMDGSYVVEKSSKFDETKPLEVLLGVSTIYGNQIWGSFTRQPGQEKVIAVLDKHTYAMGRDDAAGKNLKIDFTSPAKNGDDLKAIRAKGDDLTSFSDDRFWVMLRNTGDSHWRVVLNDPPGKVSNDTHIDAIITDLKGVSLEKELEVMLAMVTDQNNFLWYQSTMTADKLGGTFVLYNYSGLPGKEDEPTRTKSDALPDLHSHFGGTTGEIDGVQRGVAEGGESSSNSVGTASPTRVGSIAEKNKADLQKNEAEAVADAVIETDDSPISNATFKVVLPKDMMSLLLKGDRPAFHDGVHGKNHKNLRMSVTQAGKTAVASKGYTFDPSTKEFSLSLAGSEQFDLNSNCKVRVELETIYGNVLWSEVERKGKALNGAIPLDKYNKKAGGAKPAERMLRIDFKGRAKDKAIKKEMKSAGDEVKKATNEHFIIMIKNATDSDWKVNETAPLGKTKNGGIRAKITSFESVDMTSDITVRAGVKTSAGKYLWTERTVSPEQILVEFRADKYTDDF